MTIAYKAIDSQTGLYLREATELEIAAHKAATAIRDNGAAIRVGLVSIDVFSDLAAIRASNDK